MKNAILLPLLTLAATAAQGAGPVAALPLAALVDLRPQPAQEEGAWRIPLASAIFWTRPAAQPHRARALGRGSRIEPGITVEVTDRLDPVMAERARAFRAATLPALQYAFSVGWHCSYTAQMLAEYMSMTAANVRPPSIPSVWYNCMRPLGENVPGDTGSLGTLSFLPPRRLR